GGEDGVVRRGTEARERRAVIDEPPSPRRVAAVDVDVAVPAYGKDLVAAEPAHAGRQDTAPPPWEARDLGHADVGFLAVGIEVLDIIGATRDVAHCGVHMAILGSADVSEIAVAKKVPVAVGVAECQALDDRARARLK